MTRPARTGGSCRSLPLAVLAVALSNLAGAAQAAPSANVQRLSVNSSGVQANARTGRPAISETGRFVAFESPSTNLASGDTQANSEIFVRDTLAGVTERISVAANGGEPDGDSFEPSISSDGNLVAFASNAANLVVGDGDGLANVFVRDRQAGTTRRLALADLLPGGAGVGVPAMAPVLSGNGRVVVIAEGFDIDQTRGLCWHDLQTGDTKTLDLGTRDGIRLVYPNGAAVSDDGSLVAFRAYAFGKGVGTSAIFLWDVATDARILASRTPTVDSPFPDGPSFFPAISGDGSVVAFGSQATNLLPTGSPALRRSVYVFERSTDTVHMVPVETGWVPCSGGPSASCQPGASSNPALSRDGRFVALTRGRSPGVGVGAASQVYLVDRESGLRRLLSVGPGGADSDHCSDNPAMSATAAVVAFKSSAGNLVAPDTNAGTDVFSAVGRSFCDADADCNDGNPCREAGTCDLSTHLCTRPAKADGTVCGAAIPGCSPAATCFEGACVAPERADKDRDNVCDGQDNCPNDANPNQSDVNGDGQGDACSLLDLAMVDARVLLRPNRRPNHVGAPDGSIRVRAEIRVDPAKDPVDFAPGLGFYVFDFRPEIGPPPNYNPLVRSLGGVNFGPNSCRRLPSGNVLCRSSEGPRHELYLRRIPSSDPHLAVYRLSGRLRQVAYSQPLEPPILFFLSTQLEGFVGPGIDRYGLAPNCRITATGASCS